ncbi:hypothetical protein [Sphingobium sp.]|uniref:hypothetical protein n=1 Tax=Sphingobium sp. TaxID=1912891 RepID=UPI0026101B04|nr:hypothetical protein [Sphingobium sp.]
MQKYELKTPVRGLPRVDGRREPVGIGAVVMLPWSRAAELLGMDAVAESDADVTCALDWEEEGVDRTGTPPISVVAVTDRHALIDAIEELGGIAFFIGDGLPDRAEDVLADFSNEQLLHEVAGRIEEGRLAPGHLSAIGDPDQSPELPEMPSTSDTPDTPAADEAPVAEQGQAARVDDAPKLADPPAEAKPSRKKSVAK